VLTSAVSSDLGTAFTYQGYLQDGGSPADGTYNFRFYLWDDSTKTQLIASYPATGTQSVAVEQGRFTVLLDFGNGVFNGQERWLEIEVNGVALDPLQRLTAAPYALSLQPGATIFGDNTLMGMLNLSNSSGPGLVVRKAGDTGLRVISSEMTGLLVDSSQGDGIKVAYALDDGLEVASANYGVSVESAAMGVNVTNAALNGLNVGSAGNNGVYIASATTGILVDNSLDNGFAVNSASSDGVYVSSAGDDGLNICTTGNELYCIGQDYLYNGVEIGSTQDHGIWIDDAGFDGLFVHSADYNGVTVFSAGAIGIDVAIAGINGVQVNTAGEHGMYIGSAGYDGLLVCATGSETVCNKQIAENNGVEIGSTEHNGVYIDDAGSDGVKVLSADGSGLVVGAVGNDGLYVEYSQDDGIYLVEAAGDFIQAGTDDNVKFKVTNAGEIISAGGLSTPSADYAELMALAGDPSGYEPGDVLVISDSLDRAVALATTPYAKAVIGVYSTAPGILGGQPMDQTDHSGMAPVALLGVVPTKGSAENGPIQRGDLLVTSATPGHAMRADDPPPGTVLGKALQPLESGSGVILVLVTLQ